MKSPTPTSPLGFPPPLRPVPIGGGAAQCRLPLVTGPLGAPLRGWPRKQARRPGPRGARCGLRSAGCRWSLWAGCRWLGCRRCGGGRGALIPAPPRAPLRAVPRCVPPRWPSPRCPAPRRGLAACRVARTPSSPPGPVVGGAGPPAFGRTRAPGRVAACRPSSGF